MLRNYAAHVKRFVYLVCALLFLFFGDDDVIAQSSKDTLTANKITKLQKVFYNYQSLTTAPIAQGYLESAKKIFAQTTSAATDAPYQNAIKNAEIDQLKRNTGLEFNSNFLQNFKAGTGDDELFYIQRLQAGLDLNLLKNGLLENSNKIKQVELQKAINNLNAKQDKKQLELSYRAAQLIYKFNIEKIRLLKKRKEILDAKSELITSLHQQKEITNLELIHFKQSLIDIKTSLDVYGSYNEIFKEQFKQDSAGAFTLPLIDFDFAAFLKNYSAIGETQDSILKLHVKEMELQDKVALKTSLKASVRYNFYDAFYSETARNFMSAGLSFSIPIGGNSSKQLNAAKSELLKHKLSSNDHEHLGEMMNNFYEFRYKLKQYLDVYEKNTEWAELLRIERVRMQYADAEFNPIKSLNLLDEFLDQRLELIDIKQQLYLKLNQLTKYNPTVNVQDYISLVQLDSIEQEAVKFTFKKSVYVWSHAFENNSTSFLSEFLINNDIDNAIVSSGNDVVKALGRIDTLSRSNISTELLIGDNDLINKSPSQITEYINSIFLYAVKPKFTAIHLDIEPHTFADWQQNKEQYLKKFRTVVQTFYKTCEKKKIKLNVSIPLTADARMVQDVKDYCHKIYVMAYESRNPDFAVRKLKENFEPVKSKIVIALRTEDFKSSADMQQHIKTLSEKTAITQFAIHDLTRLLKFTE